MDIHSNLNTNIKSRKDVYQKFCEGLYVPIYAKGWYMDAVCKPENWDVWLYGSGNDVSAAMPYFIEKRGIYKYVTRPLLTQNNGIVIRYPKGAGKAALAKYEERIINAACEFIKGMGLDVFEEQFHWSFTNWLPFFWNGYTEITRYTYVIDDTSNLEVVWSNITSKQKSIIKKGQRLSVYEELVISVEQFYEDYVKIFDKQGIECPYSFELLSRLFDECAKRDSGRMLFRRNVDGKIVCLSFVVWDERYLYKLMGGPIPEYANTDAYSALTWDEISLASRKGLGYDFEGSVVKRISKSFREYGGIPKRYFRIRKVFNPEIIRQEAEDEINKI